MLPNRIVAFGSSSVQGRGDPEGGGFVSRLDRLYQAKAQNCLVVNLGRIGDSTAKMVERFDRDVSTLEPGLIILYPGLNDTRRKSPTSVPASTIHQFRENVSSLIQKSCIIAPTIFVSSFPIDESRTCPWSDSKLFYLRSDAAEYTEIGRAACQVANVRYLPIFEEWSKLPSIAKFSLDGLHGTPEAHEKLANELHAVICDMFAR